MFDESTIEELLDRILSEEVRDGAEALSRLMAAATVINRDWEQTLVGKPVTSVALEEPRLQKWLSRLVERSVGYAQTFDVQGVSVTVGWPAGASVTWDLPT